MILKIVWFWPLCSYSFNAKLHTSFGYQMKALEKLHQLFAFIARTVFHASLLPSNHLLGKSTWLAYQPHGINYSMLNACISGHCKAAKVHCRKRTIHPFPEVPTQPCQAIETQPPPSIITQEHFTRYLITPSTITTLT